MVCHRVCDYHHYSPEEEERLTTMVTATGEKAQGEGCHYDTMTGSTAMITTMQDRLQERFEKRTTTSSDYIIRLTDRLLRCGTKIITCFSHKTHKWGMDMREAQNPQRDDTGKVSLLCLAAQGIQTFLRSGFEQCSPSSRGASTVTKEEAYAPKVTNENGKGKSDGHEPWIPVLPKKLDEVDMILPPRDLGIRPMRTKDGLALRDPLSTCLFSIALSAILREEIPRLPITEDIDCLS